MRAVLICPGTAFQFRSMANEGYNVVNRLATLEYQWFVVSFRIRTYRQQKGAIYLQRTVRYVRINANSFEMKTKSNVGFPAWGIIYGELCSNWQELSNAKSLDINYVLDKLDNISSNVAVIGQFLIRSTVNFLIQTTK